MATLAICDDDVFRSDFAGELIIPKTATSASTALFSFALFSFSIQILVPG